MINHMIIIPYQVCKAAGGDDLGFWSAQLHAHTLDNIIDHADGTINDACLQVGDRCPSDHSIGSDQFKARKPGCVADQRFAGQLYPWANAPSQEAALVVKRAEGCRRAKVDEDARSTVHLISGDSIGNTVAAQLAGIFVLDIDSGFNAGFDHQRQHVEVIPATCVPV